MTDSADTSTSPQPSDPADRAAHPFADLDDYVALQRGSGLVLSPDGTRLVTAVQALDAEGSGYATALWEVDPSGERPARRLTRSAAGESGAAFLPDGSLLFTSTRPDPAAGKEGDEKRARLWLLPTGGGEPRLVADRPGGVDAVRVARRSGHVALVARAFPSAVDAEADEALRKARRDGKVSAILHESAPVRFWDHDLGPDRARLLVAEPLVAASSEEALDLAELTPRPGRALEGLGAGDFDLSLDGSRVVTAWSVPERGGVRSVLALLDVATGERHVLLDDPEHEYLSPRFSPDGTRVALTVETRSTPYEPGDVHLAVLDLEDRALRVLGEDWDRWPHGARWTPDGTALVVTADEDGRAPVFRFDVASGEVVRLTADAFAYSDVQVSPDGSTLYAMRTSYAEPARPVRLDATTPDQQSTPLRGPSEPPTLPGRLEEVETTAEDGTRVRSWLCLPEGASASDPAPLLLWIHGGPLGSWNTWSWRWNPWIAVARGYAVLLPDPALSTGYGLDFVRRGWGAWGGAPYTDLMAATDAAVARDDVDETRTAAMGGSFGGYMANWVAGHTDRFRAIVTHASLWALDQFGPTTDAPWYWAREMTPEMARENSPHLHADAIVTPVLVIHGDKDYRVPIGEGLRLFTDLASRAEADDGEMAHKFLYFPDENHWVLQPGHSKVWNETVLAFLDHHVLGEEWRTPHLLA